MTPLTDTQSVGSRLKLVRWQEQKSGDMAWLTLETAEGSWRMQLYGMKPEGDTITRRLWLIWNGEKETLLRWVALRTPCPAPLVWTMKQGSTR